jgi:hypothetical protein
MKAPLWIAAAVLALAPALALAQSSIDGHWMVVKPDKSLDHGSFVTFKVEKDRVHMTAVSGISYIARLNGAEAPLEGESIPTTVSVTMPAKNVLVEVAKRDGKPWVSTRMEVGTDGKTARVTWKNVKADKGGSYEMVRQ